jgi:hypothetical protein
MCGCICCGLGERVLRAVFWLLWFLLALPCILVETLLFTLPIRYVLTVLHHESEAVWSSLFYGGVAGVVFSALSKGFEHAAGAWCSSYMAVLSFFCGHVAVGWLCYLGLAQRWPLYDKWHCFRSEFAYREATRKTRTKRKKQKQTTPCLYFDRQSVHLSQLSAGGYTGLCLGLLLSGFSVLSTQSVTGSPDQLFEWCRPAPHIPLFLVCLPAFAIGLLKNMAEIDEVAPWPLAVYNQRLALHSKPVVTVAATQSTSRDSESDEDEIRPVQSSDEMARIARQYEVNTVE